MKQKTKDKLEKLLIIVYFPLLFTLPLWFMNPNDFQVNLMVSPLLILWGLAFSFGVTED